NQQKVILARALSSDPDLVILDNPTQGVDVGAKLEIYRIIQQLAQRGVSFIVLSSEAQEVLMLCDRIYVMFHGEIRKEFPRSEATEENIMIAATGGKV
ncbi:MAG: sugar ABC transporter ATP-binding protein, partial [Firmicutes bacterium]|nr:sugar ABC transporter ATP-binding protein [Bacillota bacterium]